MNKKKKDAFSNGKVRRVDWPSGQCSFFDWPRKTAATAFSKEKVSSRKETQEDCFCCASNSCYEKKASPTKEALKVKKVSNIKKEVLFYYFIFFLKLFLNFFQEWKKWHLLEIWLKLC